MALDHGIATYGGIVGHTDRLAPSFFQGLRQGKTNPSWVKIGGRKRLALLDHSRKPDGDPVKERNAYLQLVERAQNRSGGCRNWSRHAQPFAERQALRAQSMDL